MTPTEQLRDWLIAAGLANDYQVQLYHWREGTNDGAAQKYLIIKPDGSTRRLNDIGADDYFQIFLISAKNIPHPAFERAQDILDHVMHNHDDEGLNFIAADNPALLQSL